MTTKIRRGLTNQGAALLEWFDSLPTFAYTREGHIKWEDLADGHKIWELLSNLEPEHFHGDLPQARNRSGKWLDSWENLKHVYKVLAQFVKERNGKLPSGYGTIHLKEIAMQVDPEELSKASVGHQDSPSDLDADLTVQLLKMLLFVATRAADNEAYIGVMVQMPEDRQKYIMNAIVEVGIPVQLEPLAGQFSPSTPTNEQQFEESAHREVEEANLQDVPSPGANASGFDKDLLHEQQLAQLAAENDRFSKDNKDLQKDIHDLHDRIDRLHQHNSTLQEELKGAQDRLEQLSITEEGQAVITRLNKKVRDQDDLITQQETQLRDSHTETENLQLELVKLRSLDTEIQSVKDEFSIMKSERDQLTRQLEGKTNAIDKLKQKVQALQTIEKDNGSLRQDNEKLRLLAEEGNKAKGKVLQLEQQLVEYRNLVPTIEQELHESREIRKRKDLEIQQNRLEMDKVREQYNQAQDIITDLTEQARPSSQKSTADTNLDFELRTKDSHELQAARSALAIAKLTSDSKTLDLEEKNQKLQIAYDELTAGQKILEEQYAAMLGKNEVLSKQFGYKDKFGREDQIRELQQSGKIEGSHTSRIRTRQTANATQSALPQTHQDLAKEISILEIKTGDSTTPIDHGELESLLKVIREWYANLCQDQTRQSKEYQDQIKELQTQLNEQKTVIQTLLGAPANSNDSKSSADEFQETLDLVKASISRPPGSGEKPDTIEKVVQELTASTEERRRKFIQRLEVQQNLLSFGFDAVSHDSGSSRSVSALTPAPSRKRLPWYTNKKP